MIDTITGKIKGKYEDYLVISNNGIGYRVFTSKYTLSQVHIGNDEELYVDMVVREDSLSLYGFSTIEERDVYYLLTTVRGIGPKVAVGILSGLTVESIVNGIRNQDINILTQAPGVGKKTAERLILELKDKVDHISVETIDLQDNPIYEAQEALTHLGYSSFESLETLKDIYEEGMSLEELIRLALQQMVR